MALVSKANVRFIGRYALLGKLASGGMATVHVGRLVGPVGFTRMVAVKRLHPEYAREPEFVSMFIDEARLAAKIVHPNVVPTLDVVATDGELFLVMDYIHGQSLSWLIKNATKLGCPIPPRIVASIVSGCLQGLHAAHEARDERGRALDIVHRDVSPQNVIVGADGTTRVFDFGVAKAAGRLHHTRDGDLKGKLAYIAPEQLRQDVTSRRSDIYAASVILWEALTSRRLFKADSEHEMIERIVQGVIPAPSGVEPSVPAAFDAVVLKGLASNPDDRFATAREMALALERCVDTASVAEVSEWLEQVAKVELDDRSQRIAAIEMASAAMLREGPPRNTSPTAPSAQQSAPNLSTNWLGGDEYEGDEASSVSVAFGRALAANHAPPRSALVAAGVFGFTAALLAVGVWVATARVPGTSASPAAAAGGPGPAAVLADENAVHTLRNESSLPGLAASRDGGAEAPAPAALSDAGRPSE